VLLSWLLGLPRAGRRHRLSAVVCGSADDVHRCRRDLLRARPAVPGAAQRLAIPAGARSSHALFRPVRGALRLRCWWLAGIVLGAVAYTPATAYGRALAVSVPSLTRRYSALQ
jgi:hypothetical protein